MNNPKLLSPFGWRGRRFHTGIDIRGERKGKRKGGEKIYASRGGTVTQASRNKAYGRVVVIRHADGFKTRYAHLKKYLVKKGDKVKSGQPIGTVGKSGRATSPHLHFEILTPTDAFVDPKPLIFK